MPQNVPPQLRELMDQYPASFALLQTIPCLYTRSIPFEFFERGIEDLPAVLTEKIERDPRLNSVEALLAPLVLRDLVTVDFEQNTFTPMAKLNQPDEHVQHFAKEVATRLCDRWENEGWQAAGRRNARHSLTLLIREGEDGGSMFDFFRKPFLDGVEIEEIDDAWGVSTAFAKISFEAYDLKALARRLRTVAATLDQEACPQQYAWLIEMANWISVSESVDENPMQEVYELVFSARNFFEEGDYDKAADYYWQAANKARNASPEDEGYAISLQVSAALAVGSGQQKETARQILKDATDYCLHPESIDDPYLDLIIGTGIEVADRLEDAEMAHILARLAGQVNALVPASHARAQRLGEAFSKCLASNDWKAAERYAFRILDIYVEVEGPSSLEATNARYSLARIYRYSGQIERMIAELEAVFSSAQSIWEDEPQKILDLAMQIAEQFGEIQNHLAAKPYLLYAVKAIEAQGGVESDYVALSSLAMSHALWTLEDFRGVAEFLPIAVRGLEARQGRGDYQTLDETHRLVSTYEKLNEMPSARAALDRLVSSLIEAADPEDARIGSFMVAVAQTCERLGEVDKALTLVNLALPIEERHFGPSSYEAGIAKLFLFKLYGTKEDHERAAVYLREARLILRDDMPADIGESLHELQVVMDLAQAAEEEDSLTPEQKKLSQLPRNRSVHFTGRDKELAALEQILNERGYAFITGQEGVGKTEIALEFAIRNTDRFDQIFWVDCRDEWTEFSDFRIAFQGAAAKSSMDDRVIFEKGMRYLSEGNYLLICDNVRDSEAVARHIPEGASGQTIFISSTPLEPPASDCQVTIAPWTDDESAEYLAKRLETTKSEEGLVALCEKLEHSPLSLEVAAAYLLWTGASFREYTHLIDGLLAGGERATLLECVGALSLGLVRKSFPATWDLACVASQMAPCSISIQTVVNGAEAFDGELHASLGEFPSEAHVVDLLRPLQELSLATYRATESTFDIHPLIRGVIDSELTPEERASKRDQAVLALELAITSPFSHIENFHWLTEHAWFLGKDASSLLEAKLLHHCAYLLGEFKSTEKALPLYDRAIAGMEKALGERNVELVPLLAGAGNMLTYDFEFSRALPYYERMLDIQEHAPESDETQMASIVGNLAYLYPKLGLYKKARTFLDRQAEILERLRRGPSSDLAGCYFEIGELLDDREAVNEAKWFYERALSMRRQFLGDEHVLTLYTRRRLARFARAQGDFETAREQSRGIVHVTGPVPPATELSDVTVLVQAGMVRAGLGELEQAIPYLSRAITLEQANGKAMSVLTLGMAYDFLARIYAELNIPESARENFEASLGYFKLLFPSFHPWITKAMTGVAWSLEAMGQAPEADALLQEVKLLKVEFDVRNS